jgi:Lrp/AsnC family transcriptional regulator, leucine-responsive regulatory protein
MTTRSSIRKRTPATEPSTGPEAELDRIDAQILRRLQQDGRLKITKLSEEVNLSVTPCFDRVKRLERLGYIRSYHAHLNAERLGLALQAYIAVNLEKTTPELLDEFVAAVIALDEVVECQMVGGGVDFLVKVRARDMNSFLQFTRERFSAIRGVKQTHTYFVMQDVKSTHEVAVPG